MSKKTRILALVLTVVMLVGAMPLTLFAQEETAPATEVEESVSVLDALAAKAQGSLYGGISFPEGVKVLSDTPAAIGSSNNKLGVEMKDIVYVDSGDGDGSMILRDTDDDITNATSDFSKTDITFTFSNAVTLTRGDDNFRYFIASFKIAAGEALDYSFLRLRAYRRDVATTYDADGKQVGEPVITTITSGSAGSPYKDDIPLYSCVNGDFSIDDETKYNFNTELYTDFTTVIDTQTNTAYFYANGVKVHESAKIFPKLAAKPVTVDNGDGTTTVTTYEWQNLRFDAHLGTNNPIGGMFFKSGPVKVYRTGNASNVFDENGNFIYENDDLANGVFKIGGEYYYFENGFAGDSDTAECEGYTLELEDRTGRIINYYKTDRAAFTPLTSEELTAKGASIIASNVLGKKYSNEFYTAKDGTLEITAYRYKTDEAGDFVLDADGNKIVETYTIDAVRSYKNTSDTFTMGAKVYSPEMRDSFYASEADLKSGTLTPFPTNNDKPYVDITYTAYNPSPQIKEDSVIRFDLKFGDAVYSLMSKGKPTDLIGFLRLRCKNTSGGNVNVGGSIENVGGIPHLKLFGADLGPCNTQEFTNYAIEFDFEGTKITASVYVNGLLRGESLPVAEGISYIDYIGVYISEQVSFNGDLATFKPATFYTGKNLDAVTDYTGFVENGANSEYYENGKIAASGSIAEIEAKVGKTYAELEGYNVALADTIHMNFYVKLGSLATEAGAYALLTVDGEEQRIALKSLEAENGLYKLTAKVSSIQMNELVSLEIYDANGNKVNITSSNVSSYVWSCSVKLYGEYVIANSAFFSAEAVDLVKAMLLYGAFAERNFTSEKSLATARNLTEGDRLAVQYGTIGTFYSNVKVLGKNDNPKYGFSSTFNDHSADVNLTATATDPSMLGQVYLVLDSAIKIRIELNVTEAPETVSGCVLHTEDVDGTVKYFADITGLTAKDLNTLNVITVNGNVINVSALAVADAVVSAGDKVYGKTFTDLMKAMYLYYYRANAYVESIA